MVSKPSLGVRACEIYGRKWVLGQVCSRDASLNRACWEGLLRTVHGLVCVRNQQLVPAVAGPWRRTLDRAILQALYGGWKSQDT